MKNLLTENQKIILTLLGDLAQDKPMDSALAGVSAERCSELVCLADEHAVTAVLYDAFMGSALSEAEKAQVETAARSTALRSYHLLVTARWVTELLAQEGIHALCIKGVALAACYPVPELRKSGDVDLLVAEPERFGEACDRLRECGFREEAEQHAHHHVAFQSPEGISVELHSRLTDSVGVARTDEFLERVLQEYRNHITENNSWGVRLYEPDRVYHGLYLMVHSVQHFVLEGFGLRILCDWNLFLSAGLNEEEQSRLRELLRQAGIEKFAAALTELCVRCLHTERSRVAGLCEERCPEELLREVLEEIFSAKEFGGADRSRMVMLRDDSLWGLITEFHRQMRHNFPKAGGWVPLWPGLWIATLVRFLRNNAELRRVSTRAVLDSARQRHRLHAKLEIYEKAR